MKNARTNKKFISIIATVLVLAVSVILQMTGGWDILNGYVTEQTTNKTAQTHIDKPLTGKKIATVTFIDVGQGDCTLIVSGGKAMLVDAGEAENSDMLTSFLKSKNISTLDYIVATHAHSDHIGALAQLINAVKVKNIILSEPNDESSSNSTYINFLYAADKSNAEITFAEPDVTFKVGDVSCRILAPFDVDSENENNNSVVMHIQAGTTSFLLTGDAEKAVENEILKQYDLKSTVLKVGHHGSSTSSSKNFINEVLPEVSVISVGKNNRYNHPTEATLQTLSSVNSEIVRTDLNGSITFECAEDGYNYTTEK